MLRNFKLFAKESRRSCAKDPFFFFSLVLHVKAAKKIHLSPLFVTLPPPFPFYPETEERDSMAEASTPKELPSELRYIQYEHSLEKQYLPSIRALISKDLSEPYSIYVYRYFLY